LGGLSQNKAEARFRKAQQREKERIIKVSFWQRIKFFWKMASIRAKGQMRRLFKSNEVANA